MKAHIRQIISHHAMLKNGPSKYKRLDNECLFGESFEILKKKNDWFYGKLLTDGYLGWVHKTNLDKLPKPNYRVFNKYTVCYSEPSVKSNFLCFLSFGSLIKKISNVNKWTEFKIKNNKKAYIYSEHIVPINSITKDWVSISEKFIGIPYKFGGRTTFGLDCSALVQLCSQAGGHIISRDTKFQVNEKNLIQKNLSEIKRGDLIFWKDHVAIAINNKQILHANAFTMTVEIEYLNTVMNRISKDQIPIIKRFPSYP